MSVGRWFGVARDEKALCAMHMEYKTQKTSLYACIYRSLIPHSQPKVDGPGVSQNQLQHAKNALVESWSDEEEEIMRIKHMTRD